MLGNIVTKIYHKEGMYKNMKVTLPKKPKLNVRAIVIYTVSIIACIIAIIIVALSAYFGSDELDRLVTTGGSNVTQEDMEYQSLIENFDNIFQNRIEEYNTSISIPILDEEQPIVYTYYRTAENKQKSYVLDLNIPFINIDNEEIAKYNEDIKGMFEEKANEILQTEDENIIYSVEYSATLEEDILSVIIKAELKEGSEPQRTIVKTYNYDLKNQQEITLEEIINRKQLNKDDVQNKIEEEIRQEQARVESMKALGYSIFERNLDDEMYKIENTQEFFVKDGNIYIIYAYGNENLTSEMDLIIV